MGFPKLPLFAVFVLLLFPSPSALPILGDGSASSPPEAGPVLMFSEIHMIANASEEFIEIYNPTNTSVDLDGWYVEDDARARRTLDGYTIYPDSYLVVWTNRVDPRGPSYARPGIWNNAGDTAFLFDPADEVHTQVSYGTANNATLPVGEEGQSVQWDGDEWVLGAPNPGSRVGQTSGYLALEIPSYAPSVQLEAVPSEIQTRPDFTFELNVTDINHDLVSWSVIDRYANQTMYTSTEEKSHELTLATPREEVLWVVEITALDAENHTTTVLAEIQVLWDDLRVSFPQGSTLFFSDVTSMDQTPVTENSIRISNTGNYSVLPYIDVSDLVSGDDSIDASESLTVLIDGQGYDYIGGPMPLLELASGEFYDVQFAFNGLQGTVPSGSYSASFAVFP